MPTEASDVRCSFCGSGEDHARVLVAGPSAVICDYCAERARRVAKGRSAFGWFLRPLWRGMESAQQEGQAWVARVIVPATALGAWVAIRLGERSSDPVGFEVPQFVVTWGAAILLVYAALPVAHILWGVSPKAGRAVWSLFSLLVGGILGSLMGLGGSLSGVVAALLFLWTVSRLGQRAPDADAQS